MEHRKPFGLPAKWRYVRHNFPNEPYEGDLSDEFGIYPPIGHSGPVALVAGQDNAKLIAAAPDLLAACQGAEKLLSAQLEEYNKAMTSFYEPKAEPGPVLTALRAAIAKATT
jgi:hypothetical protein